MQGETRAGVAGRVPARLDVPMIAHLLARLLHAQFERSCSSGIFRREWLVKTLLSFVVISVFLFSLLSSRSSSSSSSSWGNRNAAVSGSTRLAYSS